AVCACDFVHRGACRAVCGTAIKNYLKPCLHNPVPWQEPQGAAPPILRGIAMKRRLRWAAGLALLGMAAGQGAHAQSQNFIGLAAGVLRDYDGAKDYRYLPVALINYQNGHFFIWPRAGLPGAGRIWDLAPEVTAGLFLGMSLGRDDGADRIKGLGDFDFHG